MAKKRIGDSTQQTAAVLKAGANKRPVAVLRTHDEDAQDAVARTLTRPTVTAAITSQYHSKVDGQSLDLVGLVTALQRQADSVKSGDLSHQEAMLASQAKTLDLIFHNLARRAANNFAEYLSAGETYMRLALKAQSQCRATIETLAEIKNPRAVAFVKQANIAGGHQQVNNGGAPDPARENESAQNKVLEANSGQRMDTGTQGAASGADQALAAVGEIDRATHG